MSGFNPNSVFSGVTIPPPSLVNFSITPPLADGDFVVYDAAESGFTNISASGSVSVQHDATLSGAGTSLSPLGVTNPSPTPGAANTFLGSNGTTASYAVLNKDASIAGTGKSTPLTLAIQHDGTLSGLGSVASPLSAINGPPAPGVANSLLGSNGTVASYSVLNLDASISGNGVSTPLTLAVQHDTTLTGLGSVASPLSASNALPAPGAANTFLGSNGTTASYAVLNKDASIAGTGKSTPLTLAIQHDSTLSGLGSVASPLSASNALPAPGAADTFLGSNGTTASYAVLNKDASIAGTGKSTQLTLNIQSDGSLVGAGSVASPVSLNVHTDTTLTGNGSVASPLSATNSLPSIGPANTILSSNGTIASYNLLDLDGSISGNGVSTPLTLAVQHDTTLTGLGSVASPLSASNALPAPGAANTFLGSNGTTASYAVLNKDASIAGNGKSTALTLAVQKDASLSGLGSVASPLALAIQHDSTLTGLGSVASPLTTTNALPAPGAADTFLGSDGTTASYAVLNKDASIAGTGKSTPLTLNIQKDASLTGAGSVASPISLSIQHDSTLTGLGSVASPLSAVASTGISGLFGNGSDGNVIISSNTTMVNDMYYNNLTVNNGITLSTGGFRLYIAGTLTLIGTGRISNDGFTASGQGSAAGGLARSIGGGGFGGGGGGSNSNGSPGGGVTGAGSFGGAGGNGSGGTGGVQGNRTNVLATSGGASIYQNILMLLSGQDLTGTTISGGGGGGGGGGGIVGTGGGGGGGGGVCIVFAFAIASSSTGVVSANGGNGSNAVSSNGGGGGAGGGGYAALLYHQTNSSTVTLSAVSGSAGNGNGSGTAGSVGGTGKTLLMQV